MRGAGGMGGGEGRRGRGGGETRGKEEKWKEGREGRKWRGGRLNLRRVKGDCKDEYKYKGKRNGKITGEKEYRGKGK